MSPLRRRVLGLTIEELVSRLRVGVIVVDENGIVCWANPTLCKLLATTEKSILDTPAVKLLTPSSGAQFEATFLRRKGRDSKSYEFEVLRPDGSSVYVSVLPSSIHDETGRFLGSSAVVIDRSERERLKDQLSIANQIVENSGSVLYRAHLTPDFPIEYVSPNVASYGYRPLDFTEGRIRFADVVVPEDYPRVIAQLEQRVASGTQAFTQRYRVKTASGQVRWIDDRTTLHISNNGKAPYVEGILTDVTILVQAGRERHRALVQTVHALAATIEKRDAYTAGHQRHVADLSFEIGRRLGLDREKLEGLYLGALVHDVGKIAVPVELLTKPVALSKAEFAVIQAHAMTGQDILEGIVLPWPIAAMVGQHHERLDGSGYPHGLKGDEIVEEAQIIAVADVLEAMSEHRPYRPARRIEAALAELTSRRGSGFHPAAVDACFTIAQEHCNDPAQLWPALQRDALVANLTSGFGVNSTDESRD